jgi:hypothetical protein
MKFALATSAVFLFDSTGQRISMCSAEQNRELKYVLASASS